MRRVVLLFVLAAALTACSEKDPGTPSAGGETPAASETSSKAPTSSKSPVNRPKKIDLKTITNACTLLTDAQMQQLGLRSTGENRPSSAYPGAKGCSWASLDNAWSTGVYGVISKGVDEYEKGAANGKATKTEAAGFPAYVKTGDTGLGGCFFAVDVADGQMLVLDAAPGTSSGKEEESCTKVTTYGQAMMATLASGS